MQAPIGSFGKGWSKMHNIIHRVVLLQFFIHTDAGLCELSGYRRSYSCCPRPIPGISQSLDCGSSSPIFIFAALFCSTRLLWNLPKRKGGGRSLLACRSIRHEGMYRATHFQNASVLSFPQLLSKIFLPPGWAFRNLVTSCSARPWSAGTASESSVKSAGAHIDSVFDDNPAVEEGLIS